MQAVVLKERGKSGVVIGDHPKPSPKTGEALIRMEAASLNRVDLYMRDNGAGITHELPQVMGIDGIGYIEEINAEQSSLGVGQRVILYPYEFCGSCEYCLKGDQPLCQHAKLPGEHRDGTFAQYITLPLESLYPLSKDADKLEAASLGVAYLTAWRMVFGKARASAGKTCLVVGAGGGVACASVQLAKMAGCFVIATTTGSDKIKKIKDAGADLVFDYKTENIAKAILSHTQGQGVDFVIDNVGDATWSSSLKSVKRGGDVVTCGATTGSHPSADLQRLFIRQISVHGSTMGSMGEFKRMIQCYENGLIKPVIDSCYNMKDAHMALDQLEHPDRFGKVVLNIT